MSTLAPRLATLDGAKVAILRNKKSGSKSVADTVAEGLPRCEARQWVKPSPYSPLSSKMRREIAAWADGVVACPGDCAHGSSVLRFDIFSLEAEGVPVAWIDTPGRMPVVKRNGRVFEIDYNIPGGRREPVQRIESAARRALAAETFEKWGLHRALRLAGAKAGDTVRVSGLEAELWDYPPKLLDGWDGPAEFAYVEIPSLRRTPDDVLRGWITERMADVHRLLLQ
jgi:hypothetical protein